MIKNHLTPYVENVDISHRNQIWFSLTCYTGIQFGGVYIYPNGSPFYDEADLAKLHAKLVTDKNSVVVGDLNARFGRDTILHDSDDTAITYEGKPDSGTNRNGNKLISICENCNMAVVNNSSYKNRLIDTPCTYRQGRLWISELDLLLVTPTFFTKVREFSVKDAVQGSDHAPITFMLDMDSVRPYTADSLMERAKCLGITTHEQQEIKITKSLSHHQVCTAKFTELMTENIPPILSEEVVIDVTKTVMESEEVILQTAKKCKKVKVLRPVRDDVSYWERLLSTKDDNLIWKAVDWKGKYHSQQNECSPADEEFKHHFEALLYDSDEDDIYEAVGDTHDLPYIPLLDDPFQVRDIEHAVKALKSDKGYVGIAPGLVKALPATWLMFLLQIFNVVFHSGTFPFHWSISKLITIFKSGVSLLCGNYRGISIPNSLAKLYDSMLCDRLFRWCSFDKCQAGGQPGRGCIEQIMALRLAVNYAVEMKSTLYVLFIDFSKAYDKVNRRKLIDVLRSLGCGCTMVIAIIMLYRSTKFILKSAVVVANQGVRQGASTSMVLFILYIDRMVQMIKSLNVNDGFLGNVHTMILMDDTVIMSCSRDLCYRKMKKVLEFCEQFDMEINVKKTSFFVINRRPDDCKPLVFGELKIPYKSTYCYLGSFFTDDGKISSVLKLHVKSRVSDINKFVIFCAVNTSIPFYIKRRIFQSCLLSSLLYGCETWLTDDIREVEAIYIRMVKTLLSVRASTPSINCLIELGLDDLTTIVKRRRKNFLVKIFHQPDREKPLHALFEICRLKNTKSFKMITDTMNNVLVNRLTPKDICLGKSDSHTKFVLYRSVMNDNLTVHPIYTKASSIPDFQRVAFSRLRLCSHNLISEKGRWSRTPADRRTCPCDHRSVQNEYHVLLVCQRTAHIRERYAHVLSIVSDTTTVNDLMKHQNVKSLSEFIHLCMKIYESQ